MKKWRRRVLRAPQSLVACPADATVEGARPIAVIDGQQRLAALDLLRPAEVPAFCDWLMCLAVDPEFQEDRLADYQERFNRLWIPKFGRRGAIAMYVWHVLRQSRLIDWLIRTFG